MNGFINLLKPPGMSSAQAVGFVKRLTGDKVGHAGTLDPEAAGVLPLMVGRATRLMSYLSGDEKEYIAHVSFTGATDTQDAQGRMICKPNGVPAREEILSVLPQLTGEVMQSPSVYSAIKRNGVPMYKLAREGKATSLPERKVLIRGIRILQDTGDGFLIRVQCGGGTYIRTLCHDMGCLLGKPAHMRFLLRIGYGAFQIKNAVPLEGVAEDPEKALLPMDSPLSRYRSCTVPRKDLKPIINGVPIPMLPGMNADETVRLYADGSFLGLAGAEDGMLRMKVNLAAGMEIG